MPSRRSVLHLLSAFAASSAGAIADGGRAQETITVPWSSGTEPPAMKVPQGATDCHFHIYDARFPYASGNVMKPGPATVADYRLLQRRLGTTRCVLVQPSSYGTDNRCLLDALHQFGQADARAVAVVDTGFSVRELRDMHRAGVRGVRFNFLQAGATTAEMIEPLARQVHELGWHIQINASPEQMLAAAAVLRRLPCAVVFDHLAHTVPSGRNNQAFKTIVNLLHAERAWLKLSGAYMDTKTGPPSYADTVETARAYVEEAPERLVWGTDWPHPTTQQKPDDALLLDLLATWVPDGALRSRILVDNPAELYGFPKLKGPK